MKLKILIIDDEKMLTDLLTQHFSDNWLHMPCCK